MDLMEQMNRLMALQSIEEEMAQAERDKANLARDVVNQTRVVEQLRQTFDTLHGERLETQKAGDRLEVTRRTKKDENDKMQIQLNSTRNQHDYDAIRRSMMSNQADMARCEDEELQSLDRVDALKRREAELQSEIARENNNLEDIKQAVQHDQGQYDEVIERLRAREQSLRQQIAPELLAKFDQISKSRTKHALVKVKNRVCGGCFVRVPKQIENELMRWNKAVFCNSCGRILMLDMNAAD